MKKRVLSIVLALAMMLSLLPATALAADVPNYKVVPTVDKTEITFGQEVTVTVKVTGGNYYGLDYVLQYDATKVEYVEVTGEGDPNKNYYVIDYGVSGDVGEIGLIALAGDTAYNAESVLGTFKFKAKVLNEETEAVFKIVESYIEISDGSGGDYGSGDAPTVAADSVSVTVAMNNALRDETGADTDGDGDSDVSLDNNGDVTHSVEYDGAEHKIPAIVSEANGAEVKYYNETSQKYDLDYAAVASKTDVGEYPVKYQVTAPGYATIAGIVTLKITPITLGITWPNTTSFAYEEDAGVAKTHEVAPNVTGILDGDKANVAVLTDGTTASAVGTYTAAVTDLAGAKAGNYQLPGSNLSVGWEIVKGSMDGDFTIVIEPNGGDDGLTYNGEEQPAVKTDDPGSFQIPDGFEVEYTYTDPTSGQETTTTTVPEFKDAGEYEVTVTVKDPDDQYEPYVKEITVKINPKAVTITVNNAKKFFGDEDPAFTGTVEGLVNANDLDTITYVRRGNDEVLGENNATKTYDDVLDVNYTPNDNYAVTVVKGDFTIKALIEDTSGSGIGSDNGSYTVEIIADYVKGEEVNYDLVLVYTDADVTFTCNGNDMIEITDSGYKYNVVFDENANADNTAYNAAPAAKRVFAYVVEFDGNDPVISYKAHTGVIPVNCSGCDVNASGRVDLRDAMLVQSIYNVAADYMSNQANLLRADVNHSKHVDVLGDASKVIYTMQQRNG